MAKVIRNFIDQELCKVFTNYALQQRFDNFKPYGKTSPGIDTHAVYRDDYTEAILRTKRSDVERSLNKKLFDSYSFYIVYENGKELTPHIDRDVCEISLSIHAGHLYGDSYQGSLWPIFFDNHPHLLDVGDAVLYSGPTERHWREPFEGIYQVQLMLHYVTDKKSAPHKQKNPIKSYSYA